MKITKPCPDCAIRWVDQASSVARFRLTDMERQQLVAALLVHRHLILSGPRGAGKIRFAKALASTIAQDHKGQVRSILGHPWWAADTGDISQYVTMQTDFSLWRLIDFIEPILSAGQTPSLSPANTDSSYLVASVERMSSFEVELYFGQFLYWMSRQTVHGAQESPMRGSLLLIGTYDSPEPPQVDEQVKQVAAVVHLGHDVLSRPLTDHTEQRSRVA